MAVKHSRILRLFKKSSRGLSEKFPFVQRFGSFKLAADASSKRSWKTNALFLAALWLILLIASLTVLSSVVTPFLKSLQTQTVISLNWAGYVVASDSILEQPVVTAVKGTWTIPAVTISADDTYSAAWVGIGGQTEDSLIQAGSEHDSVGGKTSYSVWYEMLPDNAITIPEITISPGDQITTSISLVNSDSNLWLIEVSDQTTGQSFRQTFNYNSSRLTAEWTVERPLVNDQLTTLADFGSITFTNATAQISQTIGTVSEFPNYEVIMTENLQSRQLVTLSPLSEDGSSFKVTYG